MKVIRAEVLGMCFGVRDALRVIDRVEEPGRVTIHGRLVHNEVIVNELTERGFRMVGESERSHDGISDTPVVLITAHGVSDRERSRLAAAGKALVDTTCPLVTRAHAAAQSLQRDGYRVVVIGQRAHVEVQGIVGDLTDYDVVESVEEVRMYASKRLGIICQTTTPERHAARVRAAVSAANPGAEIRFVDTICLPTKEHQRALERLIEQVEAVVVVGGSDSNNTRALVRRCAERGKPVLRVASADELVPSWFHPFTCVGLTAGTSTLDGTIGEVEAAIVRLSPRAGVGEFVEAGAALS